MSIQAHGDDPEDDVTVGEFDRVTLKAPNGSTTTLDGRLPYEFVDSLRESTQSQSASQTGKMVGFDWRFVTHEGTEDQVEDLHERLTEDN